MKKSTIGLFGFGIVGEGIYKVLLEKPHLGCEVKKIVIKNPDKKRDAPVSLFSTNPGDILDDDEINLVVELIDDPDIALTIVSCAMTNGKSVVSANKKMIAENHLELIALSIKNKVSFLYEAAVCGSVPIIRNLEEYFDNHPLTYIKGIVNGSTNYILSKMKNENQSYANALISAQQNGYAESDPTLDVEGKDASYKISIITLHAFGKYISAKKIICKGITSLHPNDFKYAAEKELVIKLIAKSYVNEMGELRGISVLPTFIEKGDALSLTNNENNGIQIGSSLADEQFLYGKGAGRYPTSSAVLSDISSLIQGYKYKFKKGLKRLEMNADCSAKFYVSFEQGIIFDHSIFDSVEEHYIGKGREYIIGAIDHKKLQESRLFEDNEISFISFN